MRPGPVAPTALRRFGTSLPKGHGVVLPAYHHAVKGGRTLFSSRVFDPGEVKRLLKDRHQSRKIGKVITKGARRGWPIFTLTLEERASCPRSCAEWASCYGNNMPAAERIEHGPSLFPVLEGELAQLAAEYPAGFLVRLHVLGDFWSVAYVGFWADMLRHFDALHIFGFTAQDPASEIGIALRKLITGAGWHRAAVRFSGRPGGLYAARVLGPGESDADAIICPAQTGATDCCATCALCWHSPKIIAFRRH